MIAIRNVCSSSTSNNNIQAWSSRDLSLGLVETYRDPLLKVLVLVLVLKVLGLGLETCGCYNFTFPRPSRLQRERLNIVESTMASCVRGPIR